jgi:nitroreductase
MVPPLGRVRIPSSPQKHNRFMVNPMDEGNRDAAWLATLVQRRQHVGPKHLAAPGPAEDELRALFSAAACAPDHGRLTPWRFIVLGPAARERLGQAFVAALLARDAAATAEQQADARDKAFRGPVLVLAVADLRAEAPGVPAAERLVSLGAAIQNLLLAAAARGYASGLSSGRAMGSVALRSCLGLAEGEEAVCFITLGTSTRDRPARERPGVDGFVRWLA